MGNTQSNRVEDRRWASNSEGYPPNVNSPGIDKGIELINAQQMIGLGEGGANAKMDRYKNQYDLEISIQAFTWYRDSHGLFDYEEKEKLTTSNLKVKDNFVLKRDEDVIVPEKFEDFRTAMLNYKRLEEEYPAQRIAAACMFKDNNYWMYHKFEIDSADDEKANPGDKLWLVMRHMGNDKDHDFQPGQGFKLEIGDTIKFGRVRYKVIMMQSEQEGLTEYNIGDRFMRQKFNASLKLNKKNSDQQKKKKKRREQQPQVPEPQNQPGMARNPSTTSVRTAATAATNLQPQNTHYDGPQIMGRSFGDSDISDSSISSSQNIGQSGSVSGAGDGISSSEYMTESEDANQLVDANVAPIDMDIENVATVNQLGGGDGGEENPPPPEVQIDPVSPNGQTNVEMQFSPPYMENADAIAIESGFERERQNTNIEQNQNNHNLRTGTLWFNPPSAAVTSQVDMPNAASARSHENDARKQSMNQGEHARQSTKKRKKSMKRKKAHAKKLLLMQKAKLAAEQKVCRICLGEENEGEDPLISPCKCAGTMSHIHLECLREWLNSKRTRKESESVKTYCWKALECELCKQRFPGQVFSDGSIVTDDERMSRKKYERMGKPIEILEYELPEKDYIVLESVTLQNIRIVHVINMRERDFIRVGRGHDADIRVTDISVSRFHARINRDENGHFYVEDNKSKFGTLIQIRKPIVLQKNINNYIQMGRTTLKIMINDPYLLSQNKKSDISCMQNPFTYCCLKNKKTTKMFPQTEQQELYPIEWDPQVNVKNNETEIEDKNLNTQGIDQTRDEANMSNANPSPSPRAVMSSSINPISGANDSLDRANSEIINRERNRVEESKQNEMPPNSSIHHEPDIAGAFNSVEQNLIAIENNNVEVGSGGIQDDTFQGPRNEHRLIHEYQNFSQEVDNRSQMQEGNMTNGDINMTTNIKAVGNQQINTGGENLASPVKKPMGENESPGPLSSMKFGSEIRVEAMSNTEQLDAHNTSNNQCQNLSGIFSRTIDQVGENHGSRGYIVNQQQQQNPSSSVIVENQQIDSFIIGPVGNGLLNQTDGSIKEQHQQPNMSNNNGGGLQIQVDKSEAQTNIMHQDQALTPNANMVASSNNEVMVDTVNDAHLAKTGILMRDNPKLRNLGQNLDVSQNHSVFDMTQQVVENKDLSQSQILANLDQSNPQAILNNSQLTANANFSPTGKDGGKANLNDNSLLGAPGSDHNRTNHNGSGVTGNHVTIMQNNLGMNIQEESLVEQLSNLNMPAQQSLLDHAQQSQINELQSLQIPLEPVESSNQQIGSSVVDESGAAQLAQLQLPKN